MKLWKISQTVNNDCDTYDSAVVAANSVEEARNIHPSKGFPDNKRSWCDSEDVRVEYLGHTDRDIKGVIVASFNAG